MAESASSCSSLNEGLPKKAKIPDIVEILRQDQDFLKNWVLFSDKLDSPPDKQVQWEIGINNTTLEYYVLIREMIKIWISKDERKKTKTVKDLCTVLRKLSYRDLAETLEEKVGEDCIIQPELTEGGTKSNQFVDSGKKIKYPITHGLLTNARNFSGREEQLEKIKNYFESKEQLVLVYGFGGIGKTELCRKFANDICLENNNVSCIWLHGEKVDTLTESVRDVAKSMGIVEDETNEHLLDYFGLIVNNILENSDRLLVVIDNVDDEYEEVISIINTRRDFKNKRMTIIVTSRIRDMLVNVVKESIKLEVLSEDDARTMLQNSIKNLEPSEANKLSKLLQCFPLALQQAVAYINQQRTHFRTRNYSVSQYVSEFDKKKKSMLGQELDEYERTYLTVLNMTLDTIKLECKDAGEILKIVAHLNPDNIELDFLEKICLRRKLDFDKGFNIIYKYCTVNSNENATREMFSIHRLHQKFLREHDNAEYARELFDDVFVVSVGYSGDFPHCSFRLESLHLQIVCKYSNLKWNKHYDSYIHFEEALLIAEELNRLDCALECIKLKYPQFIESNYTELSEEMKRELVEKFVLWCFINGCDDNVTKRIIMNGEYTHWNGFNIYNKKIYSIEGAFKISKKYFGENSKQYFLAINKLVRKVCYENIEKAMTLCEEFSNFQYDREKEFIYFDTIFTIFESIDNERSLENLQVERVEKIVTHFSNVYPKSVVLVGLLEAIIFDFKDNYVKALDLIKQFLPQLEVNHRKLKWWYKKKEDELKIKTINVLKREEIEKEFGKVNYYKLSLRGLEKIEKLFEEKLGENNTLTIKVKVAIAHKLRFIDREKRIKLCEFVLNSPVDTEYKSSFRNLCFAKNIHNNYDEQKLFLEKLLAQKESLGENNSNIIRIKQLLANTMEELSNFTGALDLFEQVKKYAVDCGWSEKDLKESRSNVARLKLKIGDFNYFKTREDIYREFEKFDNYCEFSNEQLQKALPIFENVLGKSDKLTLTFKYKTAWQLHDSEENDKALILLEEIIGSEGNKYLIESAIFLMRDISRHLYKNEKNYVKAGELLEKVLQYETQVGQDVTETKNALADLEKMQNLFKS